MQPATHQIDTVRLYRASEVAAILKVAKNTIINWIHSGAINAQKVNGYFRVPGAEVARLLAGAQSAGPYLDYRGHKLPWMSYLIFLLIETKDSESEIQDHARRYGLPPPTSAEIQELWGAVKKTAPAAIRRRLEGRGTTGLTVGNSEFKGWVTSLGILALYEQPVLPCREILEDGSDKRLEVEVLLCGRVPYGEIVRIMAAKHGWPVSEEALDFFARHFLNTYCFSVDDTAAYLSRVQNRTEAFLKRQTWGDPARARVALEIPHTFDFNAAFHEMAAIAMMRYKELSAQGPMAAERAKDMAMIVVRASAELLRRQKAQTEIGQVAAQQARREGPTASFEHPSEEPPSYEDLDQTPALSLVPMANPAPRPEAAAS